MVKIKNYCLNNQSFYIKISLTSKEVRNKRVLAWEELAISKREVENK